MHEFVMYQKQMHMLVELVNVFFVILLIPLHTMPGCVTCHTHHASVTHFRPILGNIVEVTLATSPFMYVISHAKGTGFPLAGITNMTPL